MERVIGDFGQAEGDTLLLCFGSLHGNEVAGYEALDTVCRQIDRSEISIRGRFVAVGGNLQALKAKRRFLVNDLNRNWDKENVERILTEGPSELIPEDRELKEIVEAVEGLDYKNYKRCVLMDLHTTSAPNGVFVVSMASTEDSLVEKIQAPIIYDLNKMLKGTAMDYFETRGFEVFAFEAGQIGAVQAIQNHVAAVWSVMGTLGLVSADSVPEGVQEESVLGKDHILKNIPQRLSLGYLHKIQENDGFRMLPGFINYHPVRKGDLLGHDKDGEIRAMYDGYLLMPLYQPEGDDGFFLVVEKESEPVAIS